MFLSQTGNSLEYFNIKNLEMEGAMVMTITEMRELKEQSSDGVLYDMAAPAVTHQEIAFEIADVKNQKVIVYDLGDDFGENMLYC